MTVNEQKKTMAGSLKLFGSIRVMVAAALFIAMSIILGKFLAINVGGSIRISLENLPVLMAGIFFGPFVGAAVGIGADVIGSLMKGYAINPFITLGAASIGLVSGIVSMKFLRDKKLLNTAAAVMSAHTIGSMIIKSLGLYIYYGTPLNVLLLRIPLYICIGALEFYIIYLLLRNKAFSAQLERMCNKNARL